MKTKKRSSRWLTVLATLLILVGIGTIGVTVLFPDRAEKTVGQVRIATGQVVMKVSGQKYPRVTLGPQGNKAALDRCDGSFIEMGAYHLEGLQPVYAAHNACKGEAILPLRVGDLVEVTDRGLYEIVDQRDLKKTWSTTDQLLGMQGDFILQTCYYGENRMKFIALAPAEDAPRTQ
ncbi:MAG: hypothetical protein GX678_01380 [Actinomycetales bacterium]|nr:hypothetical protein [Actinomycetales bacterium]